MPFDKHAQHNPTVESQLRKARAATNEDLRRLAREFDWGNEPEAVLGWMMAQKSIDLGSALTVFFNGDPERFNYLAKRDVPKEYRGAARVLDNICLRLNSGFYRVRAGRKMPERVRLEKWLEFQSADRAEGRRGRWILDEGIVAGLDRAPDSVGPPQPNGMEALRPLQGAEAMQSYVQELMSSRLRGKLMGLFNRRG